MGNAKTIYALEDISDESKLKVKYISPKGEMLVRIFESPYLARKFVSKLKYSECKLVSYPNFY